MYSSESGSYFESVKDAIRWRSNGAATDSGTAEAACVPALHSDAEPTSCEY